MGSNRSKGATAEKPAANAQKQAAEEPWEELPNGIQGRLAVFEGVGGVKIAGYVRKPAGAGPFPIVIVLHGGGPTAKATSGDTEEARAKKAADEAVRASKVLGRAAIRPFPTFSLRDGPSIRSITAPIPATPSSPRMGRYGHRRQESAALFPSWTRSGWR